MINTKNINSFFNKINEEEYYYIQLNLQISQYARTLIKEFSLSKEDFCKIVDIPVKRYNSYLNGGTNKEFLDLAKMQSARMKLSTEKLAWQIKDELKYVAK